MMVAQHALTFGPLNLIGTKAELSANGYTFEALGDDADWGNPEPIEVAVASWLQDGANISVERHENRELFIRIRVRGSDSDGLAKGEEALVLQCGRPNLLIWTPPDGDGAPCVFEVATSTPENITDDLGDLRNEASYGLKVKAFPFVRAEEQTTVSIPAPAVSQTITTIDNGNSATGWACAWNSSDGTSSAPTVSSTGGRVGAGRTYTPTGLQLATIKLTRTGLSATTSGTPYVRVDATGILVNGVWDYLGYFASAPTWECKINGIYFPIAAQNGSVFWLDTTGSGITTINSFEISAAYYVASGAASTVNIGVVDLSRSNVLGDQNTTTRELSRTLPVLGSARTQGTVSLEDAANTLGEVLVHTMPSFGGMVQPNLRVALSSGNATTVDGTIVSGIYSSLANLHTFDVAASGLLPGTYALMARIKHTSAGDRVLTWAARSRLGSNNLGGAQTGSATVTLGANAWTIVDVARMVLPPVKVGSSGIVRIELTGTANMDLDEAWLFQLDDGDLTWMDCGLGGAAAGGSANRLWIDSPTPDEPTYQYSIGTQADRSDAYHALTVKSEGHHELKPASVNVFTVCTGSTASVLGFKYFRRAWTRIRQP